MSYLYSEAEKHIKEIFWKETHDSQSNMNVPDLISMQLVKDNDEKDPDYFHHREGVLHSTSLSKCLRGVLHEMLGVEATDEMDTRKLGIFKAGNLFEDFVIASLGDKVIHEQRQYEYVYKGIKLVGRSDFVVSDEGVIRIGENKSVNSNSFWMREREGTLVAWQNQIQLETYLWLERILEVYECSEFCGNVVLSNVEPSCADCIRHRQTDGKMKSAPHLKLDKPQGLFTYISKDDCTVIACPIKYNPHFIDEIVIPALDIINEGYTTRNAEVAPLPPLVIYSEAKQQFQKNFLATYCNYHEVCAGAGWVLEATNLVTTRNKEMKEAMKNPHAEKKVKPVIGVEPKT